MGIIDFETLITTIRDYKDRRVMLTFHSIGDTDSVSSAFALAKYLANPTISTPDFITTNSIRMLERLGIDGNGIGKEFDGLSDLVILLDVNNFDDCGAFKEKLEAHSGKMLIIDHHAPQVMDRDNVLIFNDESYSSTTSIVYELLKSLNFNIPRTTAKLLAMGIISDSAEFRNSTYKTFTEMGDLLNIANADYASLLNEMQHTASIGARESTMRDLFESRLTIVAGLLFSEGVVKTHANQAAEDAIKIGADLALFHAISDKEISFSARLRPPLDKEIHLHLGRIMRENAPIIGGHGGGHPCAAGAYGPSSSKAEEFSSKFVSDVIGIVSSRYPGGYRSRQ